MRSMSSLAAPVSAAEADELARELSGASAAEILRRAAERFPGRIVLTCSWQRTSSVLVHLIASQSLDVRIIEVDTGLLFPETHEVRDRLIERLGITVETLRPRRTGRRAGRRSGLRAVAARARRVLRPAQGRAARARARGRRRVGLRAPPLLGRRARERPAVLVRREARRDQGGSDLAVERRGRRGLLRAARPAGARAARTGLPVDRLHPLHACRRTRRGRARRPLGGHREDRVRSSPPA